MMKKLSILLSLLLLLTAGAFCQSVTGNITASGSTCGTGGACVSLTIPQGQSSYAGGAVIGLTGTWSATLAFEATADGVNWVSINATSLSGTTPVLTATTNDSFQLNIAGAKGVRVRCSAFTSGTAVVTIQASPASARNGGSGGGGGGATFSPNAIQYATSTTVARGATSTDVIGIFTGCSGVQYLGADGACHNSAAGGTVTNTAGALTSPNIAVGNGGNDLTVDTVATLDGSGNEQLNTLQTLGDGVHPGDIALQSNTTDPTFAANTFNIVGPNAASMTAYGIQFPSTWGSSPPAAGLCLKTGTETAGQKLPITAASCSGGGGGASTVNLPVGAAQGGAGCSLGGNFPTANAPSCLLIAGTSTTTQRANAQFCASGPCTYSGAGGGTSTPYMDYNITSPSNGITSVTFGFRADTDTNNTHTAVWDFQYVCSAPGAVSTGTLATAQTATATLDGTTSHFLSAVLSSPTITGCVAGYLLQVRIALDATSTMTGNANLVAVQVIPQ